MKIKVNEFSVGMGPKLLQHKGKKTTYTLRLILFGGYCSMEDEDKKATMKMLLSIKRFGKEFTSLSQAH